MHMSEKVVKTELSEKERKEQKAIETENKILSFLIPIVGAIAFILGLLGIIFVAGSGKVGVLVFLYHSLYLRRLRLLIRRITPCPQEKTRFLKEKKEGTRRHASRLVLFL